MAKMNTLHNESISVMNNYQNKNNVITCPTGLCWWLQKWDCT